MKPKIKRQISMEEIKDGQGSSCRFCPMGMGTHEIESDDGTYYLCDDHLQKFKEANP